MTLSLLNHQSKLVRITHDAAERTAMGFATPGARLGIGWEPGLGKTIGVLAAIAEAKRQGFIGRTVIVAPKSILWSAWLRDAEHFADLKAVVVYAKSGKGAMNRRLKTLESDADLYITNYETFKILYRPGNARRGIEEFNAFRPHYVNRLVVDESSKTKDPGSQISETCYEFSRLVESVYMLSGTPAPNGPHEYFAQVRCVDPTIFGVNYHRFLNTYFSSERRFILGKERVVGWKMLAHAREGFMERLGRAWWTLRATDCLDLPPERDVVREVSLEGEELSCYVNLIQELQHEWQDGSVTNVSANARSMKLRQITGGNFYGESGPVVVGRSKLDAMLELLEEIGPKLVVIWAEFTAEIDRIETELLGLGKRVGRIDGSVGAADRAEIIEQFQAGKIQYLVCHPAAAAHGITLTAARYDVFYSCSFSLEQHEQARKRIHRVSQHWPVTHYYLVCPGTVDVRVLRVLRGKSKASEELKELLVEERAGARVLEMGGVK